MLINYLKLKNFRNHKDFKADFGGRSVLIRGFNGVGKSNILEAIHLLSTTKSLRTKYDRELVAHTADVCHVSAEIMKEDESVLLELTIAKDQNYENASKKLTKINKVAKSISKFAGTLNSVLFTPMDIDILIGSPALRRKYLDSVFYQIDEEYKKDSMEFGKALKQRNRLLEKIRETRYGRDQLGFWNEKVLKLGRSVQIKRESWFFYMQEEINKYEKKLNSENVVYEVKYLKNEMSEERLEKYKEKEVLAKSTLIGPHRDDFEIKFNGFDIAAFGSRGQQRTTMLALKMCELEFIESSTKSRPILLLDDIFSELDPVHRSAIDSIVGLQQTIITTALDAKDEISLGFLD